MTGAIEGRTFNGSKVELFKQRYQPGKVTQAIVLVKYTGKDPDKSGAEKAFIAKVGQLSQKDASPAAVKHRVCKWIESNKLNYTLVPLAGRHSSIAAQDLLKMDEQEHRSTYGCKVSDDDLTWRPAILYADSDMSVACKIVLQGKPSLLWLNLFCSCVLACDTTMPTYEIQSHKSSS